MTRPKTRRRIYTPPLFSEFKPKGVKAADLEKIVMSLDEYEAIRLADALQLTHEEASVLMNISRSTFSRLIDKARLKTAEMLIKGKQLVIEGGQVHFTNNILKCNSCKTLFNVEIAEKPEECPNCSSKELSNLAVHFGHGNCCIN
jgi:predicted DNA-binding protein (UPF0251 family)